jgi:hypothetical protein
VLHANTAGATNNTPGFGRAKVDPKKGNHNNKKSVALEGIEPQSVAWKSSA